MDESPTSSPSSSPDMLTTDSRRPEALQRSRVVQAGGLGGRGRPAASNAARERSRVQTLRSAFLELQRTLPSVPPDTKLSKLDVLILATTYIAHLTQTLQEEGMDEGDSTRKTEALHSLKGDGYLHPVKKNGGGRMEPACALTKITYMRNYLLNSPFIQQLDGIDGAGCMVLDAWCWMHSCCTEIGLMVQYVEYEDLHLDPLI
ncbi:hypothetical protein J4Q44_G00366300 [Coregonus suidteri]|uniref:BHLH domain-containing protein n=1 Tax=Coregonus suidteri TaxID=861788 RepID=A0AAN8KNZ8_9TELE